MRRAKPYSHKLPSTKYQLSWPEQLETRMLLAADYNVYDLDQTGRPLYGRTAVIGTDMYYWDAKEQTGAELYKLDSLTDTAKLYLDINPGVGGSFTSNTDVTGFVAIGSKLYFVAYDDVAGVKLRWVDTSSSSPTVHTVSANVDYACNSELTLVGTKIYFAGENNEEESQLSWIDTSEQDPGVRSVRLDFFIPESDGKYYVEMFGIDDELYIYTDDLFRMNSTLESPEVNLLVENIEISTKRFAWAGDKLFFVSRDKLTGQELRWIDLTEPAPTVHSIEMNPGEDNGTYPSKPQVVGNKVFFTATPTNNYQALYWVDWTIDDPAVQTLPDIASKKLRYRFVLCGWDKDFF